MFVAAVFVAAAVGILLDQVFHLVEDTPNPDRKEPREPPRAPGPRQHQPLLPQPAASPPALATPGKLGKTYANESEQRSRINTVATGLALVTSLGGYLVPPLNLLTVALLAFAIMPMARDGYRHIRIHRSINADGVVTVIIAGAMMIGAYLPASFSIFMNSLARRAIQLTQKRCRSRLTGVIGELPRHAWVSRNGLEICIAIDDVQAGDIVVVRAGEAVPVDGTVVAGTAGLVAAHLTGESRPRDVEVGDRVLATSILISGHLRIRTESTGSATVVGELKSILDRTADFKLEIQARGEVFANHAAPWSFAAGILATPVLGVARGLSLMNNTPGKHFRLVAPIAMLRTLSLATEAGILIKEAAALEVLHGVDTVVFDKTGTLTEDRFEVHAVMATDGDERRVIRFAISVEQRQSHPIARAIGDFARARAISARPCEEVKLEVGYGIGGMVDGQEVLIGSRRFMERCRVTLPPSVALDEEGFDTIVFVAVDREAIGAVTLSPVIRSDAAAAVATLQKFGLDIHVVSGDRAEPTRRLARALGIGTVRAEALPKDKAEYLRDLRRQGRRVCFVGDGVNDALALREADISVSISGASTVAMDTAQIILLEARLEEIVTLIRLGRAFDDSTRQAKYWTIVMPMIGIGGVFLFGTGLVASTVCNQIGLYGGLATLFLSDDGPEPVPRTDGNGTDAPASPRRRCGEARTTAPCRPGARDDDGSAGRARRG